MTETHEIRRKRILYRVTHRGTKEADAIVGGYFTGAVAGLNAAELGQAEALLEELDLDIIDWVMGRAPVPARWQGTLFDHVITFYNGMGPKNV
ncbi:MAG: FAD assembly factor SdhE [Candidatus Binataceae bacterium]